tara:strand:- start:702 stop:1088 length:387 start_codon:yes stop_codon:yes gene_type:complete
MMIQDKCADVTVHTSYDEVAVLFNHKSLQRLFPYLPNSKGITYNATFKQILEEYPDAITNALKADAAMNMLINDADLPENQVITMVGIPCPTESISKEKQPTKFYYLFVPKSEIGNLQFGTWKNREEK